LLLHFQLNEEYSCLHFGECGELSISSTAESCNVHCKIIWLCWHILVERSYPPNVCVF